MGSTKSSLELWGGMECSRVRIRDAYVDQLDLGAYRRHLGDLDALAATGIRKLRVPVLWEHVWPDDRLAPDWSWPDTMLARLQALGIEPIIGFMYHGSGPIDTHLLDDDLPSRLAEFAGMVARRYPWVRMYTPINEPLTTARFSCLYGHWYPHMYSDEAFVKALLIQIDAIRLSMEAIRVYVPDALLVQTEDLGYTQAPAMLAYQARFENERRWLTFDLLTGKVRPGHFMFDYLLDYGASEDTLRDLAKTPCPPDVVGINHYITSERYLDVRLDRYPAHVHGGNGHHRYADVETCRSPRHRLGPAELLLHSWERYNLPIAVTEAHIGCECEEQMRWFYQMWQSCQEVRRTGADVRACTAWALTGSCDWDSLLTQARGHFESGAFRLEEQGAVATPLAQVLKDLSSGTPVCETARQPGWWNLESVSETVLIEKPVLIPV